MKRALMLASVPSMIEQFNMNNIKILQEMGYEVDVACNFEDGGNLNKKRLEELKKELENMKVRYFHVPFQRNPFSTCNIKAYRETKKIVENNHYEIVHLHSPIGGVCGRIACRKLRKKGTRVIYTAHGFHFYKGAPIINWIIYYPIEKWLSKYTDDLITINSEDYEIARNKFKAKKTKLVHGVGVDSLRFNVELTNEEKIKKRQEIGIEEGDFLIIQVGELNRNKNQIMLIEAMRELVKEKSDIKAILVGKGSMEETYRNKIREYNLDKNVFLLGYRKDIPELLKISNCLVALSYREGLGINAVEAMLAKIPVILSKNRGHNELKINEDFMININDIDKLKKQILKIKDNKVPKELLEDNYNMTKQFNMETVGKDMKEIYVRG